MTPCSKRLKLDTLPCYNMYQYLSNNIFKSFIEGISLENLMIKEWKRLFAGEPLANKNEFAGAAPTV